MKLITKAAAAIVIGIALSASAQASETELDGYDVPLNLSLDNPETEIFSDSERDFNDFNYSEKAGYEELEKLVKRRVFERQDRVDPLWQ